MKALKQALLGKLTEHADALAQCNDTLAERIDWDIKLLNWELQTEQHKLMVEIRKAEAVLEEARASAHEPSVALLECFILDLYEDLEEALDASFVAPASVTV